jgi:hypothetical protein
MADRERTDGRGRHSGGPIVNEDAGDALPWTSGKKASAAERCAHASTQVVDGWLVCSCGETWRV